MSTGAAELETEGKTALVDRVDLSIPTRPELLFLARMTAAAVASRADFGFDQIEDLRLALDEICLTLLEGRVDGGRMRLEFTWSEDAIEVTVALEEERLRSVGAPSRAASTPKPNELSERILDALVDEHGFDHLDGTSTSWLRMRRTDEVD